MGQSKKIDLIDFSRNMDEFPPGYVFDLHKGRIERHFPNLKIGENSSHKSKKGDDYNCAAWAIELKEGWIEFKDEHGNLDLRLETYISYYENLGFSQTDTIQLEEGVIKIAIYTDAKKEFTHVARQLSNGIWTSKIGDWEDIEHTTLEAVGGKSYGNPAVIMRKQLNPC
jgi:hypothetical protein